MDDSQFNRRIDAKLDQIEGHLGKQEVNLARLTVSVEEHVRRTDLLERKIEPIEKHVVMVNGIIKFLLFAGSMIMLAEGIRQLMGK